MSISDAAQSYMSDVLHRLPDEEIALSAMESMGPLANPYDPSQGFVDEEYEKPYDPWEDGDEAPGADEERRPRRTSTSPRSGQKPGGSRCNR